MFAVKRSGPRWWSFVLVAALAHWGSLWGCGATPKAPAAPPKLALVVGINHYPSPLIPELEGATHDARNFKQLLIEHYGFDAADVKVLTDAQATRAGILTTFRRHLVERTVPGAQVVFHFSGHGAQVFDRSGDEPDRLDETLVPYDARRKGEAAGDILDDEIQGLVKAIVARGGHPTLIFDSCHSGTAVRSGPKVRGLELPKGVSPAAPHLQPEDEGMEMPRGYTLVSAAGSAQKAHEIIDGSGQAHGALTWFLTRAIRQSHGQITWRAAVSRAQADVAVHFPGQRPRLEGEGLDQQPFSTPTASPVGPPRYLARAVTGSQKQLTLNAGKLHGVARGALYGLYPLEAIWAEELPPEDAQLGRLLITEVNPMGSTGRLTGGDCLKACQAVELSRPLTPHPLPVRLDGPEGQWDPLKKALEPWAQVKVVDEPHLARAMLATSEQGFTLQLPAAGGVAQGLSVEQAVAKLLRWARWFHLMNLPDGGDIGAEITLDPPIVANAVPPGTRFTLQVQNKSRRRLYLSVLSLSDEGEITLVYPAPGAQEHIDPGTRWSKPIRTVLSRDREQSTDLIRVVFTPTPLDLAAVEQPPELSTPGTRGRPSLAGWLLWGATRGGPVSMETRDWSIRSLAVTVRREAPPLPPRVGQGED
ncbi:MAG: caspase domain-containing protein [Bradymonadia bacterium]